MQNQVYGLNNGQHEIRITKFLFTIKVDTWNIASKWTHKWKNIKLPINEWWTGHHVHWPVPRMGCLEADYISCHHNPVIPVFFYTITTFIMSGTMLETWLTISNWCAILQWFKKVKRFFNNLFYLYIPHFYLPSTDALPP